MQVWLKGRAHTAFLTPHLTSARLPSVQAAINTKADQSALTAAQAALQVSQS